MNGAVRVKRLTLEVECFMVDFDGEGRVVLAIDPDNGAFQPVS